VSDQQASETPEKGVTFYRNGVRIADVSEALEFEVAPGEPICEHRHCRCERAVELVAEGRNAAAADVAHQRVRCRLVEGSRS
jgi:hypothetical protein